MRFHDPEIFLLLPLLIPLAVYIRLRERRRLTFNMPSADMFRGLPITFKTRLCRFIPFLRLPAMVFMLLALARPQTVERETKVRSEGVDLVMALDLSTSMLAEDAEQQGKQKNRLAMAKEVLRDFVKARNGDRIGFVAFAARPYTAAPLTLDHDWLLRTIDHLEIGIIEDGTALGDAVLAAVNRLRDKPAKSRAVILITDGRGNAGKTSIQQAAAVTKALGIRVHAIGIGSRGRAVIPVESPLGGTVYQKVDADLDETTLRVVAGTTGGSYFRADDRRVLVHVFREIDRLEKRTLEEKVSVTFRELYPVLLLTALALLLTELVLRKTILMRLP
jgi:Ca-activated chloride channel family protein